MESRREILVNLGLDESIVFENPSYDTAMVGYENGTNRIVYNFDAMVEDLMEQDNIDYEESVEFIEYNTLRALPYMGYLAPIVMYPIEDMDYFFGMIEDGNDFIKYTPMLKVYDDAIVGYDASTGGVIYDFENMVSILMGKDNISYECAVEEIRNNSFGENIIVEEGYDPIILCSIEDYLDYADNDLEQRNKEA